jgi:hypothetical protein
MKAIVSTLEALVESAKLLGIDERDAKNAKEFIEHHEYGLCFDTVVTQMYEYDIEIDSEYYDLIDKIGKSLSLPNESYSFMKELIRGENKIPKPVKDQLAKVISSL